MAFFYYCCVTATKNHEKFDIDSITYRMLFIEAHLF